MAYNGKSWGNMNEAERRNAIVRSNALSRWVQRFRARRLLGERFRRTGVPFSAVTSFIGNRRAVVQPQNNGYIVRRSQLLARRTAKARAAARLARQSALLAETRSRRKQWSSKPLYKKPRR